jgi:hypothetical protein
VLVEPLHISLIPAKIIQIVLYICSIILLNRKFEDIPWAKRPILNRILIVALIGWTVYIFLDIFIFSLAAFSFQDYAPINEVLYYEGYNLAYPSLFWCNILRDFAFAGLLTHLWMISFVPRIVLKGEAEFLKFGLNWKRIILMLGLSILIIYNDMISVKIYSDDIRIDTVWNGMALIVLFCVMIAYLITATQIRFVFKKIMQDDAQEIAKIKKQCIYLSWGIFIVGFGYVVMFSLGIVEGIFPDFIRDNRILLGYIGHLIWATSPFLIVQAFKSPKTPI